MALPVQVIEDGPRNYVIKVTGSTDEGTTTIVDVSTLDPPCTRVRLRKVIYSLTSEATLTMNWVGTPDSELIVLHGSNDADMCFECTSGIPNSAGANATGDVSLNGSDDPGTPYTMYLEFLKSDPVLQM